LSKSRFRSYSDVLILGSSSVAAYPRSVENDHSPGTYPVDVERSVYWTDLLGGTEAWVWAVGRDDPAFTPEEATW
jgi:hypothetical protein